MATNQFFGTTNSAMPLIPNFNAVGSVESWKLRLDHE